KRRLSLPGSPLSRSLRDMFNAMMLPGRIKRRLRFVPYYFHATWIAWAGVCRRIRNKERSEQLLSVYGPFSMLFLLSMWATGLLFGFAVVDFGLGGRFQLPVLLNRSTTKAFVYSPSAARTRWAARPFRGYWLWRTLRRASVS